MGQLLTGSVDLAEQHQELFDRMMGAVNQPDDVMSGIIKSVVSAEDHSESSSSADSVASSYSCLPAVTKAEK